MSTQRCGPSQQPPRGVTMISSEAEAQPHQFAATTDLVERGNEMRLLRHALACGPSVVLLEGEAGVGKTRLLQELLRAAASTDAPVLIGGCQPQRNPALLLPVIEALSGARVAIRLEELTPVAGALSALMPELADVLPPAPSALGDAMSERHQIYRGIRDVVTSMGDVVLVLEDLHWADEGTQELLHLLVSRPPPQLRLILSYRREDLLPSSLVRTLAGCIAAGTMQTRLELGRLSVTGVHQQIQAVLDTPVSHEFAVFLHDRTGGLPFAVEEVLRLLQDRRDLVRVGGHWARHALKEMDVPRPIQDALVQRLSFLSSAGGELVAAVAVASPDADASVLAEMIGATRLCDAAAETTRSGLLVEDADGRMSFRHELARQAAYDTLAMPDRRRLHLAAARALAGRLTPKRTMAQHWREAGDLIEWTTAAEQAAEDARLVHDARLQCGLLQELLETVGYEGEEGLRWALALARASHDGLVPQECARLLHLVLSRQTALAEEARGELEHYRGLALFRLGAAGDARVAFREAASLHSVTSTHRARALLMLGMPLVAEGQLHEHLDALEEAAAAAAGFDDPASRAVLWNRAAILIGIGDKRFRPALERLPEFGASLPERGYAARTYANVAELALYAGHDDTAARHLLLVEQATSAGEGRPGLSVGLDALCVALLARYLSGARQHLLEDIGLARVRTGGIPNLTVMLDVLTALLPAGAQGRAAGRDLLTEAGCRAMATGAFPLAAMAAAEVGRQLLLEAEPSGALEACAPVLEVLARKGIWAWTGEVLPVAVAAHLNLGDLREATRLVEQAEQGVAALDAPAATAGVDAARAAVLAAQGQAEAVRAAQSCLQRWQQVGRPDEVGRAHELLAPLLQPDEATEQRRQALVVYETAGSHASAARVRRTLRAAVGVSVRGLPGQSLSAREVEVSQLAAAGATNKEIAGRLFVSTRTVEHHVESSMRKLGARSRRELAQLLASLPVLAR
jgi:DNA-binding CsgD family transcriptional regulator